MHMQLRNRWTDGGFIVSRIQTCSVGKVSCGGIYFPTRVHNFVFTVANFVFLTKVWLSYFWIWNRNHKLSGPKFVSRCSPKTKKNHRNFGLSDRKGEPCSRLDIGVRIFLNLFYNLIGVILSMVGDISLDSEALKVTSLILKVYRLSLLKML